jgi:chromosome partitioning protein
MAETITVLSLKGGTGKTTTVRTLADVFRQIGLDVLCVDLDPQGNLSDYFDVPADATPTMADVLSGAAKSKAAEHDGIIPATPILAEVERGLSGKMGRELVLRKALKDSRKQHDLVLIDCPPALGLLTINGLVAADWALISSEAQYFALQGVNGALEVVEQAKEYYNDELEFLGVVMNIADMRTVHSREAYQALKEHFGDKVFETVIRQSIAYAESAESGRSILEHRPDLGRDYLALAAEVLTRTGLAAQADAAADRRLSGARTSTSAPMASAAHSRQNSTTSPPRGSNATWRTSAQPSHSLCSRATTAPVAS